MSASETVALYIAIISGPLLAVINFFLARGDRAGEERRKNKQVKHEIGQIQSDIDEALWTRAQTQLEKLERSLARERENWRELESELQEIKAENTRLKDENRELRAESRLQKMRIEELERRLGTGPLQEKSNDV